MNKDVMIATLGGQPQVVTFALDWLLDHGHPVNELYLLHLAQSKPSTGHSLKRLQNEFVKERYVARNVACKLHLIELRQSRRSLVDITDESASESVLQQVRDLIAKLKQEECRLHLCISGGRRMIGLLVASTAMMLCDHQDRLWHMYTPEAVREKAEGGLIMHLQPEDGMRLIQVPMVPWGAYFPAIRQMATPQQAIGEQMAWLASANDKRCQQVYDQLTERERDTLRQFARGLSPGEVAEALKVKKSTINTYKTKILDECRIAWQETGSKRLDYHFIQQNFAPFLQRLETL